MANFVNLMNVIYPVGSIYITTSATSPASFIGGTWTKIENCTLAAGGNTYGQPGDYSGSNMIPAQAIPDHQHHVMAWNSTEQRYIEAAFWRTNAASGGLWQLLSFSDNTGDSSGWDLWAKELWSNGLITNQQPYIPYHYSVFAWKRTA